MIDHKNDIESDIDIDDLMKRIKEYVKKKCPDIEDSKIVEQSFMVNMTTNNIAFGENPNITGNT